MSRIETATVAITNANICDLGDLKKGGFFQPSLSQSAPSSRYGSPVFAHTIDNFGAPQNRISFTLNIPELPVRTNGNGVNPSNGFLNEHNFMAQGLGVKAQPHHDNKGVSPVLRQDGDDASTAPPTEFKAKRQRSLSTGDDPVQQGQIVPLSQELSSLSPTNTPPLQQQQQQLTGNAEGHNNFMADWVNGVINDDNSELLKPGVDASQIQVLQEDGSLIVCVPGGAAPFNGVPGNNNDAESTHTSTSQRQNKKTVGEWVVYIWDKGKWYYMIYHVPSVSLPFFADSLFAYLKQNKSLAGLSFIHKIDLLKRNPLVLGLGITSSAFSVLCNMPTAAAFLLQFIDKVKDATTDTTLQKRLCLGISLILGVSAAFAGCYLSKQSLSEFSPILAYAVLPAVFVNILATRVLGTLSILMNLLGSLRYFSRILRNEDFQQIYLLLKDIFKFHQEWLKAVQNSLMSSRSMESGTPNNSSLLLEAVIEKFYVEVGDRINSPLNSFSVRFASDMLSLFLRLAIASVGILALAPVWTDIVAGGTSFLPEALAWPLTIIGGTAHHLFYFYIQLALIPVVIEFMRAMLFSDFKTAYGSSKFLMAGALLGSAFSGAGLYSIAAYNNIEGFGHKATTIFFGDNFTSQLYHLISKKLSFDAMREWVANGLSGLVANGFFGIVSFFMSVIVLVEKLLADQVGNKLIVNLSTEKKPECLFKDGQPFKLGNKEIKFQEAGLGAIASLRKQEVAGHKSSQHASLGHRVSINSTDESSSQSEKLPLLGDRQPRQSWTQWAASFFPCWNQSGGSDTSSAPAYGTQ